MSLTKRSSALILLWPVFDVFTFNLCLLPPPPPPPPPPKVYIFLIWSAYIKASSELQFIVVMITLLYLYSRLPLRTCKIVFINLRAKKKTKKKYEVDSAFRNEEIKLFSNSLCLP